MSVLTANRETDRKDGVLLALPAGVDIAYKGGLQVKNSSGYVVASANAAGNVLVGVAYEKIDNSGGSSGDKDVRVWRDGLHRFDIAATLTIADIGKKVYASDDQTVTLTPNGVEIGEIAAVYSTTSAWVDIYRRDSGLSRIDRSSVSVVSGVTDGCILKYGTKSVPVTLLSNGQAGIRGYVDSALTSGTIYNLRLGAMSNGASGTQTAICAHLTGYVGAGKYAQDVEGIQATARIESSAATGSVLAGYLTAAHFKAEEAAATTGDATYTAATISGSVDVVKIEGQIASDPTGGYYGVRFDCQARQGAVGGTANQAWDAAMRFPSGGMNESIVALFQFGTIGASSAVMVSAGSLTGSGSLNVEADARIKVLIGSTAYWIPLYNTAA